MGWEPYRPEPALLEPARQIVRFFETGDPSLLDDVFTKDAVLLESVSPYVFEGEAGIAEWTQRIIDHVGNHTELRASLGEPQEFSTDEETAFLSLPVTWSFVIGVELVEELGAMVLLLRRDVGAEPERVWHVERYAWGVVELQRQG